MRLLAAAALALAMTSSAYAQSTCVSVEEDKASIEAKGWKWLAIRHADFTTDGSVVYYLLPGDQVWASPVIGGCVSGNAYMLGSYSPQTGA